jgi:hypothetical protein
MAVFRACVPSSSWAFPMKTSRDDPRTAGGHIGVWRSVGAPGAPPRRSSAWPRAPGVRRADEGWQYCCRKPRRARLTVLTHPPREHQRDQVPSSPPAWPKLPACHPIFSRVPAFLLSGPSRHLDWRALIARQASHRCCPTVSVIASFLNGGSGVAGVVRE